MRRATSSLRHWRRPGKSSDAGLLRSSTAIASSRRKRATSRTSKSCERSSLRQRVGGRGKQHSMLERVLKKDTVNVAMKLTIALAALSEKRSGTLRACSGGGATGQMSIPSEYDANFGPTSRASSTDFRAATFCRACKRQKFSQLKKQNHLHNGVGKCRGRVSDSISSGLGWGSGVRGERNCASKRARDGLGRILHTCFCLVLQHTLAL